MTSAGNLMHPGSIPETASFEMGRLSGGASNFLPVGAVAHLPPGASARHRGKVKLWIVLIVAALCIVVRDKVRPTMPTPLHQPENDGVELPELAEEVQDAVSLCEVAVADAPTNACIQRLGADVAEMKAISAQPAQLIEALSDLARRGRKTQEDIQALKAIAARLDGRAAAVESCMEDILAFSKEAARAAEASRIKEETKHTNQDRCISALAKIAKELKIREKLLAEFQMLQEPQDESTRHEFAREPFDDLGCGALSEGADVGVRQGSFDRYPSRGREDPGASEVLNAGAAAREALVGRFRCRSPLERTLAAIDLGNQNDPAALPVLIAAMREDPSPSVRAAAAGAVLAIGSLDIGDPALQVAIDIFRSSNGFGRELAASAIRRANRTVML